MLLLFFERDCRREGNIVRFWRAFYRILFSPSWQIKAAFVFFYFWTLYLCRCPSTHTLLCESVQELQMICESSFWLAPFLSPARCPLPRSLFIYFHLFPSRSPLQFIFFLLLFSAATTTTIVIITTTTYGLFVIISLNRIQSLQLGNRVLFGRASFYSGIFPRACSSLSILIFLRTFYNNWDVNS